MQVVYDNVTLINNCLDCRELIGTLQSILIRKNSIKTEEYNDICKALENKIGLHVSYNGSMTCVEDSCEIVDENETETKVEFSPQMLTGVTEQISLVRSLLVDFILAKDNALDQEEAELMSNIQYDI
jgi:chaperone required for assembly of F1-ATPase